MQNPIDIALLGIGGYANIYVSALLDALPRAGVRLIGVADPMPSSCRHLPELNALGIPVFPTAEALFAATKPQLSVITTPIPFHHDHVLLALRHGSNVLVEKPLCATPEQARSMLAAAREADRHVAVGFQWSYGKAIQSLKTDIRNGVLGKPKRFRTLVLWPRDEHYYVRNAWAGRLNDAEGRPVNDSPVSNACAHFLHNMLYVLGDDASHTALPKTVRAELYRCKEIESHDTAAIRCTMRDGVELIFLASHGSRGFLGPVFEYEFENATVSYDEAGDTRFLARFNDGSTKNYGPPPGANEPAKLFATIDAIRAGKSSLCGVDAALPHLLTTAAAHLSAGDIFDFPPGMLCVDGEAPTRHTWVTGLDAVLTRCYREGKLPSDLGTPWASPGIDVTIAEDLTLRTRRPTPAATAS